MKKLLICMAALSAMTTVCRAQWEAKIDVSELVPASWSDPRVCRQEGNEQAAAVLIGTVEPHTEGAKRYRVRTAYIDGRLPGYLDQRTGRLSEVERDIYEVDGMVGYTDSSRSTFELPSGVRLSCQQLAQRPAGS